MLKRQVIKRLLYVVGIFSYFIGSVVSLFVTDENSRFLGFFYYKTDGILCLANSFFWIFGIFILGLSLIGFFGIVPAIYIKMYSLGFLLTAAAKSGGVDAFLFILAFAPEVVVLFLVFSETGSLAISFSLFLLESASLLPKTQKPLTGGERITFREYLSDGIISLFFATLLLVYENTVIILL